MKLYKLYTSRRNYIMARTLTCFNSASSFARLNVAFDDRDVQLHHLAPHPPAIQACVSMS